MLSISTCQTRVFHVRNALYVEKTLHFGEIALLSGMPFMSRMPSVFYNRVKIEVVNLKISDDNVAVLSVPAFDLRSDVFATARHGDVHGHAHVFTRRVHTSCSNVVMCLCCYSTRTRCIVAGNAWNA